MMLLFLANDLSDRLVTRQVSTTAPSLVSHPFLCVTTFIVTPFLLTPFLVYIVMLLFFSPFVVTPFLVTLFVVWTLMTAYSKKDYCIPVLCFGA